MATTDAVKSKIAEAKPAKTLIQVINDSAKELGRALPDHLRPERLVRIAMTCIRTNPKLAECTQESFLGALFTSAQIGIEPIAGRAYLLPFGNNRKGADGKWAKVYEVQFILGYKGLAELFYRHEKAIQLDWGIVREGDEFDYQYGSDSFLKHRPKLDSKGKAIAYWVQGTLANGGRSFKVMGADECMQHGKDHSKTWITEEYNEKSRRMEPCTPHFAEKSPWNTDPDSMCLKTVLIQLMKLLPLSVEVQRIIQNDESSRDYQKGITDVLDIPSTTSWDKTPVDSEIVPEEKAAEAVETPKPNVSAVTGKEIEFGK